MNIYSLTDLTNIVGNYETWGNFLNNIEWNQSFNKVIINNKVKFETDLTLKQIKELYNEYKKSNKVAGGLKGVEDKFKNKIN